ncbi:hypothetical protein C8Q76DRAFT_787750 [Earliella scabrosa]|nr:hypothetical protein C8Q76DRAFT_787750 [Earliella scabrosa]
MTCPIRIPERLILAQFHIVSDRMPAITNGELPWSGDRATMVSLPLRGRTGCTIVLQYGRCEAIPSAGVPNGHDHESVSPPELSLVDPLSTLWANIVVDNDCNPGPSQRNHHECPAHHILTWPRLKNTWQLDLTKVRCTITLAFQISRTTQSSSEKMIMTEFVLSTQYY